MAELREVFPHVLKLALPLPFELDSVNVYLVTLADGYLLIDCGMETESAFEILRDALEKRGIAWPEIRLVLLTHMHPDHMGMASRLLTLTGAELAMHQAELKHLRLVTGGGRRIPWQDEVYQQAGVPKGLESKMDAHFSGIRKNFHDLTPNQLLSGGEEIPTSIGPLEVVWTSGHSPGHICLYCRDHKLLFSGDQILEKITPNIAWHPDRDMLAEFLESLQRLAALQVDLILPSHGEPFSGHRAWIEQTTSHHRERCDEILGLVQESPQTAHQMVARLWRRPLSPINHHFAVFEVMAHLEHMRRQGRVRPRDHDGVVEWHP